MIFHLVTFLFVFLCLVLLFFGRSIVQQWMHVFYSSCSYQVGKQKETRFSSIGFIPTSDSRWHHFGALHDFTRRPTNTTTLPITLSIATRVTVFIGVSITRALSLVNNRFQEGNTLSQGLIFCVPVLLFRRAIGALFLSSNYDSSGMVESSTRDRSKRQAVAVQGSIGYTCAPVFTTPRRNYIAKWVFSFAP